MKGKSRCKILKEIRKRIAEENGIEFITSECKYKGDCSGTCPKCESEVRYLEAELERKISLGYKVTLAGLAVGITFGSSGCAPDDLDRNNLAGDLDINSSNESVEISNNESSKVSEEWTATDGELEISDNSNISSEETMGEEPWSEESLMGDIPVDYSEETEIELDGEMPISYE